MLLPWHCYSVTLDTNCFILKGKDSNVDKLFSLVDSNHITIYKTDVVDTELSKNSQENSKNIHEDLGDARVGHSRIDHAVIASNDDSSYEDLMKIVFPETKGENPTKQKVRDIMALTTHKQKQREIFVTNDGTILQSNKPLLDKHGIRVMNPVDCVKYVINQNKIT